jgi:hypothetical protein
LSRRLDRVLYLKGKAVITRKTPIAIGELIEEPLMSRLTCENTEHPPSKRRLQR